MPLDCETEKGREWMNGQFKTMAELEKLGYVVLQTAALNSEFDAFIARDIDGVKTIVGVAEIKTRDNAGPVKLTVEYLKRDGYLITHEKVMHGQKVSKFLSVPFYVIVRLVNDHVILFWKMTDDKGEPQFDYPVRPTTTQATCNGGTAVRNNAYLPIQYSKQINLK